MKLSRTVSTRQRNLEAFAGLTIQQATFITEYMKDFAPLRAAQASGIDPDKVYDVLREKGVRRAIERLTASRLDDVQIDAEWLAGELADNHLLARQHGNINGSNRALDQLAKLQHVDAYAANKVEHSGDVGLTVVVQKYGETIDVAPDMIEDMTQGASEEGVGGPQAAAPTTVTFL